MRPARRLVAALRLSGVVVLLGTLSLVLLLVRGLRLLGRRFEETARLLRRSTLQGGARALLAILGVRVHCIGTPPTGRFVLVSNHLSYLDVALLASVAPSVFVAKSEVRVWPLLGPIVRAFGTVFLDREKKVDLPLALAAIEGALRLGEGVVLFPEGTTSDGSRVAPFRSSLLALPARRGLPVHAASLHYATPAGEPPAAESVCWWGDGELLPHLTRLAGIRRVEATLRFAPEPLLDSDRKRLASRLEEEVRGLAAAQVAEPADREASFGERANVSKAW